jgi:hypothetical protein
LNAFAETHFRYDDDPDLPGWKRIGAIRKLSAK